MRRVPVEALDAAGQQGPITQLETLAELHKSGAVTDAEFDQQKRRILGET